MAKPAIGWTGLFPPAFASISCLMESPDDTRVLYNDTCPVCRFEIDSYRRTARAADLPIRFDPLRRAPDWGITAEDAARRLHVCHRGQVISGLPAFRVLWASLPGWGWLAWLTGLPVLHPLGAAVYDHVLAPLLYRAHRRRSRKTTAP
jgi:predicted DCC family thiol-disulfide oxidoreductase YuxK